jgi:hypothetical protein
VAEERDDRDATAISGSPTSANVAVGSTSGGSDIVAAINAASQGHIAATIAAGFDKVNGLAANGTVFAQVVTAGGTSPAGTINVLVDFAAPVS